MAYAEYNVLRPSCSRYRSMNRALMLTTMIVMDATLQLNALNVLEPVTFFFVVKEMQNILVSRFHLTIIQLLLAISDCKLRELKILIFLCIHLKKL